MAIDWSSANLAPLLKQLRIGRVSLFAGAGFSLGARNKFGESLPLGERLAQLLAERAGIERKGESLPIVFEAVEPYLGTNNLWSYLTDLYTVKEHDRWYEIATALTWFRIYTTNIDDLFLHLSPFNSSQKLETVVRGDAPRERDPHFDPLQCVHLHGHISHPASGMTFTLPDFAAHTARPDPWYQSLVSDMYSGTFLFIGSSLEEPMLAHYLELREQRPFDAPREYRPKSYLVSPTIGKLRLAALASRNIEGIEATAEEFFTSLTDNLQVNDFHLTRVRDKVWPHLFSPKHRVHSNVAAHFDLIVPDSLPIVHKREASQFFLGAEPAWEDISQARDGDREITEEIIKSVQAPATEFRAFILHGPAGSGKTTTLMRAAQRLSTEGLTVLFGRGFERMSLKGVAELVTSNPKAHVVVFVDIVSRHIDSIDEVRSQFQSLPNLTLVMAERTNRYVSKCQSLAKLNPTEIEMPDLAERDVNSILDRLQQFGFLGALKNRTRTEQVGEFMSRANRQLLVAMREATSGKQFDMILQDEFEQLIREAQLAYTICCIAVSRGAPGVLRKHLLPCIPRSRFTKGVVLEDLLRGVLVMANPAATLVKPRHGLIAWVVANQIAPIELRYEALQTFLIQVSGHIGVNDAKNRTPPFVAYRGMVNSDGMFELLSGRTDDILSLYEEIRPYYDGDALFWLQYAMANIKANRLDVAENFLNQSLNISPNSHQAIHQKGILLLMRAVADVNAAVAQERAKEGIEILADQITERSDYDSYPHHAYLIHVGRWYSRAGKLVSIKEWESLRKVGRDAKVKHPRSDEIREAVEEVETLYLRTAIKGDIPS